MSETIHLDIPIDKSPMPAALDMFYDFVKQLFPVHPNDRIGILGTALTYDIHKIARLYNDYVVRAFADRTVTVSPIAAQGAGDRADRYSERFVEMLGLILAGLDVEMSPADQAQVDRHQAAIDAISTDRDAWLTQIDVDWNAAMVRLGIDPSKIDTDEATRNRYYLEHTLFLTQRHYDERLNGANGFNTRIRDRELKIRSIRLRAFPDDDTRQIYNLYDYYLQARIIRPKRPELEIKYKWDEFTIQDPRFFSMPAVFDIGPGVDSIIDPRAILTGKGARGYAVDTNHKETHAHDRDWNVSGSGSYMWFIRGDINANSASHFRSSISRIRSISVGLEYAGELQIVRDNWFASTIFDTKRVKDYLKNAPILARKLSMLTTGLLIGRGLTLTLQFADASDVHEWGSSTAGGSGGVSLFGYSFGGGGGGTTSFDNHTIDTAKQTVTFKDSSDVCRLLGVRVTKLDTGAPFSEVLSDSRPLRDIPELLQHAEESLKKGRIPDRRKLGDRKPVTKRAPGAS